MKGEEEMVSGGGGRGRRNVSAREREGVGIKGRKRAERRGVMARGVKYMYMYSCEATCM